MDRLYSDTMAKEHKAAVSSNAGRVLALSISSRRGIPKKNVRSLTLIADWGAEGDSHAGRWHRQVSLLAVERIAEMCGPGIRFLRPGAMAENITTEFINPESVSVGTCLRIGAAELRITQRGKECHKECAIYRRVGNCAMRTEGLFARVIRGGRIAVGDEITVIPGPVSRRGLPEPMPDRSVPQLSDFPSLTP